MKKTILFFGSALAITMLVASCATSDPNSPGFEFAPDMYRSPSYESNSSNGIFADSMSNRKPAEGTIAVGFMPYAYQNNDSGYAWAGRNLKNPFPATSEVIAEGKKMYDIFCTHCHGASGKGDGKVGGKLPGPPPAYDGALKNLTEGAMFHSIHYGKGNMGSHASQLTADERWKIIRYVQTLQHPGGMPAPAPVDSTKKQS